MEHENDRRAEIEAADDTGLVASEELIANLRTALPPGHAAHETVDRLSAELRSSKPQAASVEHLAGRLRGVPQIEAIVANWWDNPRTQKFIADLGQIGL